MANVLDGRYLKFDQTRQPAGMLAGLHLVRPAKGRLGVAS